MRFELEIAPIDLSLTLGCGQTFRWKQDEGSSWTGVLGGQLITLRQNGRRISGVATPGGRGVAELTRQLLRADDDIDKIQRALDKDTVLATGMRRMRGLRIVKLDEWECLISYALATYANIPRIMKMIDSLAVNYGKRIEKGFYSFPDRRSLSKATVGELRKLGLGYRADYIKELSILVDDAFLSELSTKSYDKLRNDLIELPGVGEKVADCVSLFGFGRLESFPIDVWIERALMRLYGEKGTYRTLRAFAAKRFGPYAGYAQEYLYHNERMHARDRGCAFSKDQDERAI